MFSDAQEEHHNQTPHSTDMDATQGTTPILARQDHAMLIKRGQCGSEQAFEDYNLGLHIFAVFLILTCGTCAASLPVLVKAFPKLAISQHALFISRHFGTGVLIALAFAHLLPTAFENLWNECLPYFWTERYDAAPGFIAMVAALAVVLVEMGFSMYGIRHTHDSTVETEERPSSTSRYATIQVSSPSAREVQQGDRAEAVFIFPNGGTKQGRADNGDTPTSSNEESDTESTPLLSHQKEQRMILQCLLLEAGILFHSVFIGLSISISTGTTFIALMIAIAFHQIFEGLALGARIAAIPSLRISSSKPWAMAFAVSSGPLTHPFEKDANDCVAVWTYLSSRSSDRSGPENDV